MQKGNWGGLRLGSGRGKSGWYKDIWCDSSWELAWVVYHLDHKIEFKRNKEYFNYIYKNKIYKYYPDFIIDDVYFEIKGRKSFEFLSEKDKNKINQFKSKIIVLFEKDLTKILQYVIEKYGKNYISLYDNVTIRNCKNCDGYIHRENKRGVCKTCISLLKKERKILLKNNKKNNSPYKTNCLNFIECGKMIRSHSKYCKECYNIFQRKVINRPSKEQLKLEVTTSNYCAVGRKYGVSDNTIRKWLKK